MNHTHHHDHSHHARAVTSINTAFVIGISLNLLFVIIQVIVGLHIHSMSLLSDAGHNFADVGSLALSLLAFKLMKTKSSKQYTYGFKKASVLATLLNAIILLVSVGAILYESVYRLIYPQPVEGLAISIVSGIGIVINAASALLFLRDKDSDMNIKSTYLHQVSDALVSLALVVGGIIMYYTNWYRVDGILSILVAVAIIAATWKLLKDSLRLSLDGVPKGINIDEIRNAAMQMEGVKDFHHIHVWVLSTTENALTAHLVVDNNMPSDQLQQLKQQLKHELLHKNIQHVTLETEAGDNICEAQHCDAKVLSDD